MPASMSTLSSAALVIACALLSLNSASAAPPKSRVLKHIVMYKFKDGLPQAQIDEVVAAFSALPKQVDTIVAFERGTNTSTEGKSQGLTHVFVVTFRDQQGLDTYLKHPAHLAYVKIVQDRREKVVVFDYWTEE